jgi:precorrin-6B methylase 2
VELIEATRADNLLLMLKRLLKSLLPRGRARRRVLTGLYRQISLELDLDRELTVWLGLYERETYRAIRALARECHAGVDLGAGHGELSIHLLQLPHIDKVVAVEPRAAAADALQTNVQLNLPAARQSCLNVWRGYAGTTAPEPHRSLAGLCDGLRSPIFIKIDVDGPEYEILAESEDLLRRQSCRLFVETHSVEAEEKSVQLLQRLGYETQIIKPAWWRRWVPEQRPLAHNRWFSARPADQR